MSEWPLVGRGGELARLEALVSGGEGRGVVLAGPAGVGKTRLAVECLNRAADAGVATARVTATSSAAGLPFGALAPLLPPAEHRDRGAVDDRADLLRRSAVALLERAQGRRLVLLVDDAHLLDAASATLVHQLCATDAAFVLATIRLGEPAPDPILALWKDGLAERVELGGLRAEAVEELLAAILTGPVDRVTSVQLTVRSQGNVLFLRELVLGALADGTLRDDDGVWHLVGPLAPSARLIELVEARLAGLDTDQRSLLELVSFGEPLGTAELTALSDPATAEILERKALLISAIDGRRLEFRLAHALYGDVLRAGIPAVRTRIIARSLAETVEASGARRREDTLRVATWRLSGGGARPELLLAAATTARWRYDFPLAEQLARAAMEAGAGFDAALLAAKLTGLQGEDPETELVALAPDATTDVQRALVALARLDNLAFGRGQLDQGFRVAEEAEAAITDPAWRDEITARRSWLMITVRGPAATADAALPLLERTAGRALVTACAAAAYSLGRLGRLHAALEAADRGYAEHLSLTTPMDWYPSLHLYNRGRALADAGRFDEADALADATYQQAVSDRSDEQRALSALLFSQILVERGRVRSAARFGNEGVALSRRLDRPTFIGLGLIYVALAHALGGAPQRAADALAALDALTHPGLREVDLERARAWTVVANGDVPLGCQHLEEAAVLGRQTGDLVGATAALHDLARLGHASEIVSDLKAVTATMEGNLAPARVAHTEALASSDPAGLDNASRQFEAMGSDLLAAEAAADAAVAWLRAGRPRDAAVAERRAGTLADRCEGASTPALRSIDARARLTPAERETALLASAGRSNKDIAEELSLSVRTVESRLQHVYDKLGLSGRADLAAALETSERRPPGPWAR